MVYSMHEWYMYWTLYIYICKCIVQQSITVHTCVVYLVEWIPIHYTSAGMLDVLAHVHYHSRVLVWLLMMDVAFMGYVLP